MPVFQLELQFDDKGALVGARKISELAAAADAAARGAKDVAAAVGDATKAAKSMSTAMDSAWKTLRSRSVASVAAEMKSVVSAFRDIKKDASSTAQDVSRAYDAMRERLRGLKGEISSIQKAEGFNVFGMGLGKIGAGLAGLYSVAKLKDFASESFDLASTYETLGVVVQQVGKVSGYSAVEIDKNVSALRRMGIAGVEARKTMTQLLQAQVDITQTPALARIAQDAAVIGGTNSSEAFERLVHGIQSAQTDVLRTIGISVNFEQAYAKMATQVGKTTAELTEQEKVQARTNAVMEAGERIAGTYEAAMSTVGKQISSLTRLQNDSMTDFGKLPLEIAKATGVIEKYSSALDQMSRTALSSRAKLAGISQTSLEDAFASGGTQGGRDLVESVETAKDEIASLERALGSLSAKGIDLSGVAEPFRKTRDEFFANQEEIIRLERLLSALSEDDVDTSSIVARLEAVRLKTSDASTEMQRLRSIMATVFSIATARGSGVDDDAHVQAYSKALEKQLGSVDEAYAKTATRAKELKIQAVKDQQSALQNLVSAGKLTAQEAATREKAFKAELDSLNKNGSNSASKVENATEKWKQFRLEIAALNGEGAKGAVTLEKQNKEIADAGKAAGKSAAEIKAMQNDYASAFQSNALKDFNKHVVELEGNAAAIRDLKIEEEVRKWTTELSSAGIAGADLEGKITRLKDALAKQAEAKDAQTSLSFIKEYSQLSGDFSNNQKILLEMLDREAEVYSATLPASLQPYIEKHRELKALQEARDPLSGSIRGLRSYSNEAMNLAKGIEGAWTNGFQGMEDALVKFTMSGKLSFSDMANSIISDLMRIAIRSSITGPLASGLGSFFSGLGGSVDTSAAGTDLLRSNTVAFAAHGNVFSGSGISSHSNSVVTGPTLFNFNSMAGTGTPPALRPFAKGAGLMGEAGWEAVMPLTRNSQGDLSVNAVGMGNQIARDVSAAVMARGGGYGGNAPQVFVSIQNNTGAEVSQQTRTDNNGNKRINVIIGDAAAQQVLTPGSALDKANRARFGIQPQATRR